MASFNLYLKDSKATTETPIYVLFDDGVNRCKLYVQLSINPKAWNSEKREMRKSLTGYSEFNAKLKMIQHKIENLHLELTKDNTFTIDVLKERYKHYIDEVNSRTRVNEPQEKTKYIYLTDFAENYLNGALSAKTPQTIVQNKQSLKVLFEFESYTKKKIAFDKINLDFYEDYIAFMTKIKMYAPNTLGRHIKTLKMFLNEASERGINTKFDFKSKRFKAVSEKVENIYLTEGQIQKIYETDFSANNRLERTRDLFIIGCYTGLRFSDFSQLNKENISGGFISVITQKTSEKVIIPLHWTVTQILNKYAETKKGLPRPMSNQKMNEYLKEIGEIVGIDETIVKTTTKGGLKVTSNVPKYSLITTHTARRSFATNLYLSGFPSISIMKITGHRTEKAFMSYIKISQEENAQKLIEHWQNEVKLKIAK